MESQFLIGLRTRVAGAQSVREGVSSWGHLVARPGGAADLRAPVSGVVEAGPGGFPSPGVQVRPGDVLALLREVPGSADRAALTEQRAAANTRLASARRVLALAERDAEQVVGLGASLPDRERLERSQALEEAREAYRQADLAAATLASGATATVRSPMDGRLGGLLARPGDQVQAGDPLFRVLDARSLWAEVQVPEAVAPGIVEGAQARVWVASAPDRPLDAVVLDAGQEVDPTTGLLRVTLAVEGGGESLRPGMGVEAWIARGEPRLGLVVPDGAVVDSGGAALSFVRTGPESFAVREIALGARVPEGWEVRAGLAAGERVVIDGTYALKSIAGR
jgi:cobalt-zinc-cadmium efflux system membrane fusion protein